MTMTPILVSVKMKRVKLITLFIVLLGIEFVNSSDGIHIENKTMTRKNKVSQLIPLNTGEGSNRTTTKDNASPTIPDVSKAIDSKCPLSIAGVYIMGFTIGILFIIIICLLVLIYKRNIKVYIKSNEDNTIITKKDTTCKYVRQLSTETNNVSYTRENSNDEGRFKLQRQGSKMTIVDYPNNLNVNEKKGEETNNSRVTLNKVLLQQPVQIHRDQMKAIIQGVLLKTQRFSGSSSSLSNLDKILNEEMKSKESDNCAMIDKSASSGILDIVENFESLSTPKPAKKSIESSDYTNTNKLIETNSNVKIFMECNRIASNVISDVINTNGHLDDVYDNPPKLIRPLTEDVCDNKNDENVNVDDFYDDIPKNKPVFNASARNSYTDDIYDNPPSNRPVFDKSLYSNKLENNDDFDVSPKTSKGIVVTDDDHSQYVLTLTHGEDNRFDSSYTNAKSLKESSAN